MPPDEDGPEKATDDPEAPTDGPEAPTDDVPTGPLIHVDVSRETVQKAERLADECGIALEDALARLTAYDFPADAPADAAGVAKSSTGP